MPVQSGVFVGEGALQSGVRASFAFGFCHGRGATARASAVTAAIVKTFAVVLCFMIISFAFINCLHWYSRQRTPKSGQVLLYIFDARGETGFIHRRTHCGNHKSVERLGQW